MDTATITRMFTHDNLATVSVLIYQQIIILQTKCHVSQEIKPIMTQNQNWPNSKINYSYDLS